MIKKKVLDARYSLNILNKLHEIENKKCIYNIHYCKAGVGFVFFYPERVREINKLKNWRIGLSNEKYYPTLEEAIESEFNKLNRVEEK